MSDELIGKTIGGYTIENRIGRGGMATVYCATQTSMNRTVALKVLPREFLKDDAYLARFEREVKIVAQLEHRNIVPVHDYGEFEGQPYIVMRYMSAGSVDDLLLEGPLPPGKFLSIVEQIAPALDYAHSKHVLHRDLKPSNVLLDDNGSAYITDFGIARMLGVESQGATITTQGVVGTPSYMSPEQAQGQELDGRSDIYALGVMLFEMATGRRPFISDTPYSIAVMQVTAPPPAPRTINPKLSSAVEQVIFKALKKKPQDRYQTATEMAHALRMAIERPHDFIAHDTQPHPTAPKNDVQVTQPSPVSALAAPAAAVPRQPAYQPAPASVYMSPQSMVNPPVKTRRKRANNVWLSIAIGAGIGCALLALVIAGLVLAAGEFLGVGTLPTPTAVSLEGVEDITLSDGITGRILASAPTATEEATTLPDPAVVPMNALIYFAERDGSYNLYRLVDDENGVPLEYQLTSDLTHNLFPMASPHTERIVFQSNRDGDHDLYTLKATGGDREKVFNNDVDDLTPAWSPDGAWIAFASDTQADGNYDLVMVRPDGSDLRRVLSNSARNYHPRFSPDGEYLVFTTGQADDARTWEIAIVEIATGDVRYLTDNDSRDAWATFSPDGEAVIFVRDTGDRTAIYRKGFSATAPETQIHQDNHIWGLNYSPDGERIVFNSGLVESAEGDIYTIDRDGDNPQRRITTDGGLYASWAP